MTWKKVKGNNGQELLEWRCSTCKDNVKKFYVCKVPVAKKRHQRSSHRLRVIAECPRCKKEMTVGWS